MRIQFLDQSWIGSSPGGGHGNPLQYSCLENPMDRGAWKATVHGMTKSKTGLKWFSMPAGRLHVCKQDTAEKELCRGHSLNTDFSWIF